MDLATTYLLVMTTGLLTTLYFFFRELNKKYRQSLEDDLKRKSS